VKIYVISISALLTFSALAKAPDDQNILINSNEAEMVAAIQQAQSSLGEFLEIVAKPPKGASEFRLKVRITDSYGTEHFWVMPFKATGSGFVGILADEPEYVKSVKYGQKITFTRSDITDWGYKLNGKQKGSFTVCVLFKHMPADEVEQYRKEYGFEC
jgi:uncharacterized protein YegJ (DUF2314 family)